jgi:hypothetical protein
MSEADDVAKAINRTALIENLLNQIITVYFVSRNDTRMFFWDTILDSSIMPIGPKIKVVTAIAHKMRIKFKHDRLHKLIACRNEFAHHKTHSHPILHLAKDPEEQGELRFYLKVLRISGVIDKIHRQRALDEFSLFYEQTKDELINLRDQINKSLAPKNEIITG